jgi:hypothetical protein
MQPPKIIGMKWDGIPDTLKSLGNWVGWRFEYRAELSKPWTKVPTDIHPSRLSDGAFRNAASNRADTWVEFDTAEDICRQIAGNEYELKGPGFCIGQSGIVGIDLDNCREADTGAIADWAVAIINDLNTYTEISPSGTGLRLLAFGELPKDAKGKTRYRTTYEGGVVEMYDHTSARFLTITGHHVGGTPSDVQDRPEQIASVHQRIFSVVESRLADNSPADRQPVKAEDELIVKLAAEYSGDKFRRLWAGDTSEYDGDHSRADLALCSILAFYTGNDPTRIDFLFRQSGLMRDKWERDDYREDFTIAKAVSGQTAFFDWDNYHKRQKTKERLQPPGVVGCEADEIPLEEPTFDYSEPSPAVREATRAKAKLEKGYFSLFELRERRKAAPPQWVIEDHLICGGLGFLLAESGTGKTFVAIDMACCVAHGEPFLGKFAVEPGAVVYVGQEGCEDFDLRCESWHKYHKLDPSPYFVSLPEDFDLTGVHDHARLMEQLDHFVATLAEGIPLQLVVFDTFFNMLQGEDENAPGPVGSVIVFQKRLQAKYGCAILNIDHPGHDNKTRPRGHSSKRPAANSFMLLEGKISDSLKVTITKQKNRKPIEPYQINFSKAVPCGIQDDLGRDLTYPVAGNVVATWAGKLAGLGDVAANVFKAVHARFGESGFRNKDFVTLCTAEDLCSDRHARRLLKSLSAYRFISKTKTGYIINPKANPAGATWDLHL